MKKKNMTTNDSLIKEYNRVYSMFEEEAKKIQQAEKRV